MLPSLTGSTCYSPLDRKSIFQSSPAPACESQCGVCTCVGALPRTHGPGAAQVRMRADACFTQWDVEFAAAATFSRASRLAPLFGLVFRRSSCQHPLLAGALGAARAYGAVRAACGSGPWV